MKQIRIAILGQGRSGWGIHATWLKEDLERFKVIAVADSNPGQTVDAVSSFGARTYGDYRQLIADSSLEIDLLVNALPSRLHPEATLAALNRGWHVISEKPVARTVAEFDQIVATAEINKCLFLPFQNSRFNPMFIKTQEIIQSGVLGKVLHIRLCWSGFARRWDWQVLQDSGGGNLLNTGPHPLDMAVVLLNGRTPAVFAKMISENPWGDADNLSLITLHGEDMPVVEIVLSSFMSYPMGDVIQVSGTQGCLSGNNTKLQWRCFDPEQSTKHSVPQEWVNERKWCSENLPWKEFDWENPPGFNLMQHLSQQFYSNVHNLIVKSEPRLITLEQVREQVRILEACWKQNPLPKRYTIRG